MSTKKKVVSVTRKASVEDKLNSVRWESFVKASGIPLNELTDEWWRFFDKQADVDTASTELVRLIDVAIQSDVEKK